MLRASTILLVICFFTYNLSAQLNVSTTSNAGALVNSIVGPGVQVTNVTLNCNGAASGTFTSNGSNIGLSSGIVLATGRIQQALGPNNSPGDDGFSNSNCFNASPSFFDANLSTIEPQANFDGCVLEFDIKPVCDIIEVKYVFASEEYPEFVGSEFNDAFGFFIWGPNPNGGNYSATNIAQIPGAGVSVAINNINQGANTQYYVNNNGGSSVQYDGFTIPLTASVAVTKCANYHLKFAIADAGDCAYSSAVFLANGGVGCPNTLLPQLSSSSTPVNCGNDGTAQVTVANSQGPITYNWQPSGQTTATATNLGPGTYTCTVGFSLPCPFTQTVAVNLSGNNLFTVSTSSTNSYCNNPTGTASTIVSGGILPYSSPVWNTNPPQNTNTISGLSPGTYSVSVSDASGCTVTKSVVVNNTVPTITIQESILNSTCNAANGEINITSISGGTSPYTFSWNTNPISTNQDLLSSTAGDYSLTLTDVDGCTKTESFTINNIDSVLISITSTNEYCDQLNGEINVSIVNGIAPFTWDWSHSAALNDSLATGLGSGIYSFTVSDNLGCTSQGNVIITNIRDVFPGEVYTRPEYPSVNVDFAVGVTLPVNWNVTQIVLSDGSIRPNETEIILNYPEYGDYVAYFYVESDNGCLDTIAYNIFVKDFMTIYIPNAFTPNGDVKNNVWRVYGTLVQEINILVFNRWGQKIFESTDLENSWDGTYKGKTCEEDTYIYKVTAKDYFDEVHRFVGHVNLFR